MNPPTIPTLQVVREAKLAEVLADAAPGTDRLEASGVIAAAGWLWVGFDNLPDLARIGLHWAVPDPSAAMIRRPGGPTGVEDLAADPDGGGYFGVLEDVAAHDGHRYSQILVFDDGWRQTDRQWTDIRLTEPNKGVEGLAAVRRQGRVHLLALAEGPVTVAGARGGGRRCRLRVLILDDGRWRTRHTVELPPGVDFADYSSLAVDGERIAVVSQRSSALWGGTLAPDRWAVDGAGTVCRFPRDGRGRVVYGTVEGVAWLDRRHLVVVSDRAKRDDPRRIRAKDQSIHVIALP